jgi:hypothetical protein
MSQQGDKIQRTKTPEELAEAIVADMVNDLNIRIGVGSIWRQLDSGRRQEICSKWKYIIINKLTA